MKIASNPPRSLKLYYIVVLGLLFGMSLVLIFRAVLATLLFLPITVLLFRYFYIRLGNTFYTIELQRSYLVINKLLRKQIAYYADIEALAVKTTNNRKDLAIKLPGRVIVLNLSFIENRKVTLLKQRLRKRTNKRFRQMKDG